MINKTNATETEKQPKQLPAYAGMTLETKYGAEPAVGIDRGLTTAVVEVNLGGFYATLSADAAIALAISLLTAAQQVRKLASASNEVIEA